MKVKYQIIIFLFTIISIHAFGQAPTASVSVIGQNYYCGAHAFTFSNNSSTTPGTIYKWNFGRSPSDTTIRYNNQAQSATYNNAGTYTVSLTVIYNGQTATATTQVTIYNPPVANYTANPIIGCAPLNVSFTNTSTAGSAPITTYMWDFGNGVTSLNQNPSYTFDNTQTYTVTLNVKDANNCESNKPSLVVVTPKPTLNVTAGPLSTCVPPLTVNFTNSSTGSTPLTYVWSFGDGSANSTAAVPPPHVYNNSGTSIITVTAKDQYNCTSTQSFNVSVSAVTASFTTNTTRVDTACQNQWVKFTNTSGVPGRWVYNNGQPTTVDSCLFTSAGIASVNFIAGYGTSCSDTASRSIRVLPPPNVNFGLNPKYGCDTPHVVTYTNLTNNMSSWNWSFTGGIPATFNGANPPPVTYNSAGNKITVLNVTNMYGCKNSDRDTVFIQFPNSNPILDTVQKVCNDKKIPFSENSTCNTRFDQIVGWLWDFGDTTTFNGQNPPPHDYNDLHYGKTKVTLTITTQKGCTATDSVFVYIGKHQIPGFFLDTNSVCAQEKIIFHNVSTDTTLIEAYKWVIGDTAHIPPLPRFTTFIPVLPQDYLGHFVDTGKVPITLFTYFYGCKDSIFSDSLIVRGPIIYADSFWVDTSKMSCSKPMDYYFFSKAQHNEFWQWNFDDTTMVVQTTHDTTHHFYLNLTDSNLTRLVRFSAHNTITGCVFKDSIIIYPRDVHSNFKLSAWEDTICYKPNMFNASKYKDAAFWKWDFGDGSPQTAWGIDSITHIFPTSGFDTVWLYAKPIVQNELQCVDSVSKVVRVFKPEVNFRANLTETDTIGCAQLPLTTHFKSLAYSPDTKDSLALSWKWYIKHTLAGADTLIGIDSMPVKSFPVAGRYNVRLEVTDSLGCVNIITKNNYITSAQVNAEFTVPQNVYCVNENIIFNSGAAAGIPTDIHPNYFIWHFGNGDTAHTSFDTINYNYPIQGNYTDTLYAYNSLGCWDTIIKQDYIQAQNISADFTVANTDTSCYRFRVRITNNTDTTFAPMTYSWSFGDNATSTVRQPSHWYTHPGTFNLVYTVKTSHMCEDSDTIQIHVGGPYAEIKTDKNSVCKGEPIVFSLDSATMLDVDSVFWEFLPGYTSSDFVDTFRFPYVPAGGLDTVKLFIFSDDGCSPQPPPTPKVISVQQVIAEFDRGVLDIDTAGCQPFTMNLDNNSIGGTSFRWNFGDGTPEVNQSSLQTFGHTFSNTNSYDSTYYVTLYISNAINCTDTVKKQIIVHPKPKITISSDTLICVGQKAQLMVSGGFFPPIWKNLTNPSDISSLNNFNSSTPLAGPVSSTLYQSTVTTVYGCTNSEEVYVAVQQKPTVSGGPDTTILIGEVVNLYASSAQQNVSFEWIPASGLSCTKCDQPIAQPLKTTEYTINVTDSMGCFTESKKVVVKIDIKFSVDVPTVFTPNGDNHNDRIFAKGWGIKTIKKFAVYNRWGQAVYETEDSNMGWDGTYNGKPQPTDTYTYVVDVELFDNTMLQKKGNFNLLR